MNIGMRGILSVLIVGKRRRLSRERKAAEKRMSVFSCQVVIQIVILCIHDVTLNYKGDGKKKK